ncbi:MAG: BON domain-containing protein [Pseudomonadota bacterium]
MTSFSAVMRRVATRIARVGHYIAQAGPVLVIVPMMAIVPLAGCTSLVIGAGATAGVSAMQERGFQGAVSDAAITANLWRKYLEVDENMFRMIDIEVVEGEVLLAGNVRNPEHQLEAVRIAWQTDGVKRVHNEIAVTEPVSLMTTANDLLITTRIKTALMFDTDVYAINYSIETVNGTVYIMGIAQNETERDQVISHARNTGYVRRVISHVRLKDDPTRQRI